MLFEEDREQKTDRILLCHIKLMFQEKEPPADLKVSDKEL